MVVTFEGGSSDWARPATGGNGGTVRGCDQPLDKPWDRSFDQFLGKTRAALARHPHTPDLLSFEFDLPGVEPFTLWETASLGQPPDWQTPYCYWEEPHHDLAILAMGLVAEIQTAGTQRFSDAQKQLQQWQRSTLTIHSAESGRPHSPQCSSPRWFASFTFFEEALPQAPFAPGWIWLPRWQVLRQGDQSKLIINHRYLTHWATLSTAPPDSSIAPPIAPIDRLESLETTLKSVWTLYQQIKSWGVVLPHHPQSNPLHYRIQYSSLTQQPGLDRFQDGVEQVLQAIEQGRLQKVVLAHTLEVRSPIPFDLRRSLQNLRQRYPGCYLFCWGNRAGESFIGASPERLLRLEQGQLQTEALAGSAPRGDSLRESNHLARQLLSNPKELHEHQLVVDFIVAQLRELGITPQRSPLPQLRKLSQIQHLHTAISASLDPLLHPLAVLAQLHPTPAVAGVPRPLACEYIRHYENHDRSLYAAPLGWIDGSGNCEFIVGIRSAFLQSDRARLMAGAGIVKGSTPQREVAEVQLKLQTMLRSLS